MLAPTEPKRRLWAERKISAVCACALFLVSCGAPAPTRTIRLEDDAPPVVAEVETIQEATAPTQQEATETPPSEQPIEIAIMLPLSGPVAPTGQALLNAATMALFDAYDPRLKLKPVDTAGNPDVAREKAMALSTTGVAVVLGPLLSENVTAVGELLNQSGIPVIGFSNDLSAATPTQLVMGFSPEAEVKRVVDYALGQGLVNFGALIPEGRYGTNVRSALGDAIVDGGGHVSAIESYSPVADALFEPVKRLAKYDERRRETRREIQYLRSLRDDMTNEIADTLEDLEVMEGVAFDAVLVPEGGALMSTLGPLLPFYEIDPNQVKLLGTGLWNDPTLLGEPPLQGAWFAAPTPDAPDAFLTRYEKEHGVQAPRIATLAYDAMSLVAALARDEVTAENTDQNAEGERGKGEMGSLVSFRDERFALARLKRPEGFIGIDGAFRFLPDGTTERALAVLEINGRGLRVVDPALNGFPVFGYGLKQQP